MPRVGHGRPRSRSEAGLPPPGRRGRALAGRLTACGVADGPSASTEMANEQLDERPPGDSREQREAERVMLDLLSQQLGKALAPHRIVMPSGARVEVDGADTELSVLVEC
jgi:hypothetical protein